MYRRWLVASLALTTLVACGTGFAIQQLPGGGQGGPPGQAQQDGELRDAPPLVLASKGAVNFQSAGGPGGVPQGVPDFSSLKLQLNPNRTITVITAGGQQFTAQPQLNQEQKTISFTIDLQQGANLQGTVVMGDQPPANASLILIDATGTRFQAQTQLEPELTPEMRQFIERQRGQEQRPQGFDTGLDDSSEPGFAGGEFDSAPIGGQSSGGYDD